MDKKKPSHPAARQPKPAAHKPKPATAAAPTRRPTKPKPKRSQKTDRQKRMARALRESENRYSAVVETADEGMGMARPSGLHFYVNERMADMLGYTVGEIIGKSILDFIFDDQRALVEAALQDLHQGHSAHGEVKFRRRDGSAVWSLYHATPMYNDQGEHTANFIMHTDVTERKQTEEALRASVATLKSFYDSAPFIMGIVALEGDRLVVVSGNDAVADFFETRRDGPAGRRANDFDVPDATKRLWVESFRRSEQEAAPVHFEYPARRGSRAHWMRAAVAFIGAGPSGYPQFSYLVDDITERKRAEDALRESMATLQSFYDSAPFLMGIAELDGDKLVAISVNDALANFFGARPEAFAGRRATDFGVQEATERLWIENCRRSQREGAPVRFEYPEAHAGRNYWLRAAVAFVGLGPSGRPRFSFVADDISDRRQAEEALHDSMATLQSFYDSAPFLMGILELDGDQSGAVSGNGMVANFFGLHADEFAGRSANRLGIPAEAERLWIEHCRRSQREGAPVRFEYQEIWGRELWRSPAAAWAGREPWIRATVAFIGTGPAGRPRFSFVAEDITDRKQTEETQRAGEARYRQLAEENARLLEQSRADAQTKAILLREVNHRVKNNLAAIIGLLQIERHYLAAAQQTPYQSLVDNLTSRVQSLARVHSLLSASQWAPLRLDRLAENVLQVAPAILANREALDLQVAPTTLYVTPKQANAVGLILNELATNSLKHAQAVRPEGAMRLSLVTTRTDGKVCLEYRDTGPGYPAEVLQGAREGVGLYLMKALVEQDLGGQITFENDQGAVARLTFALDLAAQLDAGEGEVA